MEVELKGLTGEEGEEKSASALNSLIAVSVALLATFMAICEIKSGNVDQAMQRLQIDKNDTWAWYQARNIRQEVLRTSARQLRIYATGQPEAVKAAMIQEASEHDAMAHAQGEKMVELDAEAKSIESKYEAMNIHDDQLDLEAASLSIAISLLAMTALTRKRWLFVVALVPIALGVVMGLAGLLGWGLTLGPITRWLS
jgi:hypothetical protein